MHTSIFQSSVSEMRSQCAEYILSHSDDFLPYLTHPDTGDQFTQSKISTIVNIIVKLFCTSHPWAEN